MMGMTILLTWNIRFDFFEASFKMQVFQCQMSKHQVSNALYWIINYNTENNILSGIENPQIVSKTIAGKDFQL